MQLSNENHSEFGLDTSFIKSVIFRKQLLLVACTAIVIVFLILLHTSKTQGKAYNAKPSLKCTNTSKSTIRVLCLILASANESEQIAAVDETWAGRCDKHLFINGQEIKPTKAEPILNAPVPEKRNHLTMNIHLALEYVYKTYKGNFDWIFKCDTDTYVIMENLRNLLSHVDSYQPGYLGFHMKSRETQRHGYMSGRGSYAISWQGLHQLIHKGFKNGCREEDGSNENLNISLCLNESEVPVLNSYDKDGKETFHQASLKRLLIPPYLKPMQNMAWNQFSNF
ncbi:glycoprotein-N-acetylgalactosamine 3-beta-galactosyltransferase 1-like, partial [Mercenaria mercenaria]|uniref:glycoprotein-N-acetylgalactosamine 3-beta-galactosyltransferase 1-like n=1 Tax=Mercenaria mercenaria TaxID=6596 RepID=UPI00234EBD50